MKLHIRRGAVQPAVARPASSSNRNVAVRPSALLRRTEASVRRVDGTKAEARYGAHNGMLKLPKDRENTSKLQRFPVVFSMSLETHSARASHLGSARLVQKLEGRGLFLARREVRRGVVRVAATVAEDATEAAEKLDQLIKSPLPANPQLKVHFYTTQSIHCTLLHAHRVSFDAAMSF